MDGRAYLPAFVLPKLKLFVEVKPSGFLSTNDAQVAKDKLAYLSTTHPAILVCGDPGDYRSHWFGMDSCDGSGGMSSEEGGGDVNEPRRGECAYFKVDSLGRPSVELAMMTRGDRDIVDGNWESIPHDEYQGGDEDTLNRCAMAARAARFEFKGDWKQKKIAHIGGET